MTGRLYYDSQDLEFDARVVDHDGAPNRVVLDRTAFYPTSGGQQHDTGTLGGQPVVDVVDDDRRIIHVLAGTLDAVRVHGVVDADRRLDHSIQHTAQHLLSALAQDHFGWPTVSVHFGAEHSLIELEVEQVSSAAIERLQRMANDIIALAVPVTWGFEPAATATGLRKPTERRGVIRVVTIEGIDRNACGGTHVASTARLGAIWMEGTERVRHRVRLAYRAGDRILRRLVELDRLVVAAAKAAECADVELPQMIARHREESKLATNRIKELATALGRVEAESLLGAAIEHHGRRRLVLDYPTVRPIAALESLAHAVAEHPGAVFLAGSAESGTVMMSAHQSADVDCGALLKSALAAGGGRGGGPAGFARGRIGPEIELGDVIAAIRSALEMIG